MSPVTVTKDSNGPITAGVERCCACYHRHSEVLSRPWSDTPRPNALARRSRPGSLQASSDSSPVSERPRTTYLSEHCIPVSSADTRRHRRSANRHLLAVPRFPLNTYGRRAFSVAGPMAWKSLRNLPGIQRTAQTVLGVYLKRTCSRV